MAKIESIEIFPGENGGHRVVHNFKREAGKKSGAMDGGVYMERPKPGELQTQRNQLSLLTPRSGFSCLAGCYRLPDGFGDRVLWR
jgi:hypothetical protein